MNSLVQELQQDALTSSVSVLDLLRKALVVATKLNIPEFKQWIESELSGYSIDKVIPDYRHFYGSIKGWNPYYHAWIPVILPENIDSLLSNPPISDAISQLEHFIFERKVVYKFNAKVQELLREEVNVETEFVLEISVAQIKKIIESVKDIVLRWSLKLEEDGILGEGITFSPQEKAIASHKNYTVLIHNYGNMNMNDNHSINMQSKGNIDFSGVLASGNIDGRINQNINDVLIPESQDFLELIQKLKSLKELFEVESNLSNDDKETALEQIAVLENEVKTPNQSGLKPVKTAIAALKGVTSSLPSTTLLVKNFNDLILAITELFKHIHF